MSGNKKDKKLINAFESIPKFMTYSRYDKSLDRQFYKRNLKDLLDDLKRPKHYKKITPLENIITKYPYELYSKITDENKEGIESLPPLTKDYLVQYQSKKTEINNKITKNKSLDKLSSYNKTFLRYHTKKNNTAIVDLNNIDPFKYNPNYNSIFKNTRTFKIYGPTPKKVRNSEELNTKLLDDKDDKNNKNMIHSKILLKKIQTLGNEHSKNSENIKSRNLPLLTCITDKTNNTASINSFSDKNNHAIQFWQYTPRKENILNVNDKVSYIEPYNILQNQRKIVNFKKMLSRNELNLYNKNEFNNPTICYYNPNYNYLKQHIPKITIDSSSISRESRTKKFALQKILKKYDIKKDYEIIDNSKLNDKIDISI